MTKVHITKKDNAQEEVGVQMRTDNQTPQINNSIWWNGSERKLVVTQGGTEYTINTRVIAADPVSPQEGDTWINSTTNAFKYHTGGITYTIDFSGAAVPESSDTKGGYLKVLDDAELKVISDISTAYPDYLIESFQDEKSSVALVNAEIESSRLSLPLGQTSGTYERSQRTSTKVNHVDGIMVASLQGLAPKEITDNLDGTHTVKFHGDLTSYFAAGKKIFAFELANIEGIDRSIYLLDAQDRPALLNTNAAPTYTVGTDDTSVVIDDQDLDLSLGIVPGEQYDKVRFCPFGMKVEAAGDGTGGTYTELTIEEAHSLEERRILGISNLHRLEKDLAGSINRLVIQHSPNKQNWLILAQTERISNSNTLVVWFSKDGLSTITQAPFNSPMVAPGGNESEDYANNFMRFYQQSNFNPRLVRVFDDGRFMFSHYRLNLSGYYDNQFWFGRMDTPQFEARLLKNRPAAYPGSSIISTTTHAYDAHMDWDEASGTLAYMHNDQGENGYVNFFTIDFTALTSQFVNYYYMGADYMRHHYPAYCKWVDMEGERMLFMASTHSNGNTYAQKLTLDLVQTSGFDTQIATTQGAYTASEEGGTRYQTTAFVHQLGTTGRMSQFFYEETTEKLFVKYEDTSNNEVWLAVVNFGRTRAGQASSTDLTWDLVPDAGSLDLLFTKTETAATGNVNILPGDSNTDIENKIIAACAFIGAGEVTVTGDFATGRNIQMVNEEEITVAVTGDNFTSSSSPVTTTIEGTSDFGLNPRWLYWDSSINEYISLEFDGEDKQTLIPLTLNRMTDWDYTEGVWSASAGGRRFVESRMYVDGDTVYFADDLVEFTADYDYQKSMFCKIPNYRESFGLHSFNDPGSETQLFIADPVAGGNYGERFAQLITFPDAPNRYSGSRNGETSSTYYSDGNIPVRTLALKCRQNWAGSERYFRDDQNIQLKIVGVAAGEPDEGNVLAVSTQSRQLKHFPQYDDAKYMVWNFDDLRIAPGTQIALIIDPSYSIVANPYREPSEGVYTNTYGMASFAARSLTTSLFFRENGGVWENQNYEMWWRIYDYYLVDNHMAQDNQSWKGPAGLANTWHWNDMETTLAPIGPIANKQFMLTYRNCQYFKFNSNNYSSEGAGHKTYYGTIDDTGGQYAMPVWGTPEIVGTQPSNVDKNMVFGINLGAKETKSLDPRTGTFKFGDDEINQEYNLNVPTGMSWNGAEAGLLTDADVSGTDYGNKVDTDFESGRCLHFRAQGRLYWLYGAYSTQIGYENFVVEMEFKPDPEDLQSSNYTLCEKVGFFRCQTQQGKYYFTLWLNTSGSSYAWRTNETVHDGYHKVRYGRNEDGPFIHISTDGGTVWTPLTFETGLADAPRFKNGVSIGTQTTNWAYMTVGSLIGGPSQSLYGKLGYVKVIIGSDTPSYDGKVRSDDQRDRRAVYNFGDRFIGMFMKMNSDNDGQYENIADAFLSYPNQVSSIVDTNDQMFKYRETISTGRDLAVRLTLEKNGDEDPANMQGFLLNYEKK